MIEKIPYGKVGEDEVFLYKLDNGRGLSAEILSYGGIVKNLTFDGVDMVLGKDSLSDYMENGDNLGVIIGRNANRLGNAQFTLNDKTYTLAKNNGNSNHHGGNRSFARKVWESKPIDKKEPGVEFTLVSPDGDEGFPGKAKVKVTYTLTKDNSLLIEYEGKANKDTIINMTHHSYFNLNGHDAGDVGEHTLTLLADFYTPANDECLPTGEVLKVDGTEFDLREGRKLKESFETENPQIKAFGGFDHNFALSGRDFRKAGTLEGDLSGIKMDVYTDALGMHVYTANGLNEEQPFKNGAKYKKHSSVCLETQAFPNAMAYSHFPNGILRKGEKYNSVTSYVFYK